MSLKCYSSSIDADYSSTYDAATDISQYLLQLYAVSLPIPALYLAKHLSLAILCSTIGLG
jgi:hypothetical protein